MALGDTTSWAVSPNIRVEELARTTSEVCTPVETVDTRADVRAAAKSVQTAERDRKAIDYTYVPTVDLTSRLGYSTQASFDQKHVSWSVGAVLAWSLYDGGDRYGLERQRAAASTIAREQLTQKKRDATLEVTQATRAITVAQANLEVATQTRDLARESARLSRIAFVNGSGTSFDLVDSARRLREAEIDLLIKDFDVFKARIGAFIANANCSI